MMESKKTCLHDRHVSLGATMSPFAGYDMPIEYSGLDEEHTSVRMHCGVFDVSHMGEVDIKGLDALRFVDHIFTNDASSLSDGQCAYGMMTREDGGTVDDLLVYRRNKHDFMLVINASNTEKDVAWILSQRSGFDVEITDRSADYGQLAVQGPESERVMREVLDIDCSEISFYHFTTLPDSTIVSRTGYTGEDGFEVYATPDKIVAMWDKLIEAGVTPCGLGCRDTLRFEAGLPLYGDELDDDITPIEAGLGMFVKLEKPEGFIGRDALAKQKSEGPDRKLVGLEIDSQATARHGFEVLDNDGTVIGHVTTGYNSISVGKNIAMAFVKASYAPLGTQLQVKIRRKSAPATVIKKRFYITKYKK